MPINMQFAPDLVLRDSSEHPSGTTPKTLCLIHVNFDSHPRKVIRGVK